MKHPKSASLTPFIQTPAIPFEQTDPELAQDLMDICSVRNILRKAGKYIKPVCLTTVEPISVPAKTGRNEPCPCGSGKKFKKCCQNKIEVK